VGTGSDAAKQAGSHYRRAWATVKRPVQKLEDEAHHLHEVEEEGESGEAPFIAILGLILFLVPIFLLMLGLAMAAYYLAR
jgi:hypothetical protein